MVDRKRTLRADRKRKLKRARSLRACTVALALIGIIILLYIFWPRFEYVSVKEGVAIVDLFYSSTPKFTDETISFLESKEIEVDVHKDENVTVELYRHLPRYGYRLIVLRVHAGILGREGPTAPTFLFTEEPYTAGKYVIEQLSQQVLSGVIDPYNPHKEPVFTIGPLFVTMSMEGNFNGSIIVLSSCLGLYTDQLAEAFIQKGAKAFISWDEKVSLTHTDKACILLLQALLDEGMTVGEAVEKIMTEVGPDQIYTSKLRFYPKEAANLKLQKPTKSARAIA